MTSEETGEGKTGIWFWKWREMSAGGDWWQRRGAATVGLTGWGSAQIRETKREKLLVEVEIPRHDRNMRGNEERKRGIPKPRKLSYIRTPGCQKKERDSRKRKIRYPPPHQPCTDYELPKVECRTPLSPALQSNCFRRCCWKVPYKGCKGVMKGKAPTIEREREGIPVPRDKTQQDTARHNTARHNTEEQDKTATSNNRQTRRCPWIGKMQSGDILYSIVPMQQLMGKQRNKVKKWKEKFFSFWNRKTYLRNMKQGPFTFLSFTSYTTYRERNKNIFKFCKKHINNGYSTRCPRNPKGCYLLRKQR